jgi:creatinase
MSYGMSLLKPGVSCAEVTEAINVFLAERDLLQYRTFGYGHSFGVLSHYYGREAGSELREDIDTVLEPGMVISMEPMLTIPEGSRARAATGSTTSSSSPRTGRRTSPASPTARA